MCKLFMTLSFFTLFASLYGQKTLLNLDDKGVIIDGYDAIAYFTEGKPVQGQPEFQSRYNGSVYYFTSNEHKNLFDADPKKYEVQFGGFCAYAVSQGHVSPINPNFCYVQKDDKGIGRLICQHNQKANDLWNKNANGLLIDAYKNWPAVERNGGKQIPLKGVEHFYINLDGDGLANQGYDVVAYHIDNKALKGDAKFTEWFHGAKYIFTSREHQELFRDNPKKYLPQYGGFCAYAMSLGKVRPVNPEIFSLEDGRLMLQHTKNAYDLFYKDVKGNIVKADNKWPGVEQKKAGHKVKFDKPAK
ncbi:MAG: YHS domain-containing protein [Bacteroidetes bacterium]|nr:YHS domain-containing protein [Bacteroidota bacterium]